MTAPQLLEAIAAMVKKGMTSDDILDAMMKLRGGSDDPKAEGAADRAIRRQASDTARSQRYPNATRLNS